jgi:hypothetical protein
MKITKRHLRRILKEVWTGSNMGAQEVDSKVKSHMKRTEQPTIESDVPKKEELSEDDEWSADPAAEKDAFLDSMVEMWLDHLGMSGVDRVSVIHALNGVYQDLIDENR